MLGTTDMSKSMNFDAKEVSITPRANNYFTVTIETDYEEEVLSNFTPEDILNNYSDLDDLYKSLKEYFGDDE